MSEAGSVAADGGDTLASTIAKNGEKIASVIAAANVFQGEAARLRLRSSRPWFDGVAPAPPLRRGRSWRGVMVDRTVMLMVAVGIGFVAVGQWSFPAVSQQVGDPPRLLGWRSPLTSGEPAPLGLTLRGRADDAVVMITGLVPGMALSTGSRIGVDTWQVPATALTNAWIVPPTNFVGVVDLVAELRRADKTIADRRRIKLEWQAAIPAAGATSPTVETDRTAAAPPHEQSVTSPRQRAADEPPADTERTAVAPPREQTVAPSRQLDPDEIAALLKRGEDLIRNGDLAAARVVLRRAAEAKSAEAALTLGKTYDPVVLRELKFHGVAPDVAMARSWYEKAKELGSPEAPRRLEILARAAR